MSKEIVKDFIIEKIEHSKKERTRFMLIRNILIVCTAAIIFVAHITGHIHENWSNEIALVFTYIYGGAAVLSINLEISYRITKYKEYNDVLNLYTDKEITPEEADLLIEKLNNIAEIRILIMMFLNNLLYTMPIVIFLAVLYYFITVI